MDGERPIVHVSFDGCCEPVNPGGYGSYGVVIEQDGEVLLREATCRSRPLDEQ